MVEIKNETPQNIEELKKQANNKLSYKERKKAIEELGKYKCQQSKDILWRIMINDKIHSVQNEAFLKLQAFGEKVKLPKSKKGHHVKDINKKLCRIKKLLGEDFSIDSFKNKFLELYPEAYDIYSYHKKDKLDKWIENTISNCPKKV